MGSIHVKGTAQKVVDYDLMRIRIGFHAEERSASDASEKVMKECEAFLSALKEKGVDISTFKLSNDSVREESMRTGDGRELYNTASRAIQIDAEYNMSFVNMVREILNDSKSAVSFNIEYSLSDTDAICEQLQIEAIKSAKEQAENMACAIGKEIVGLISADKDIPRTHSNANEEMFSHISACEACSTGDYSNSEELKATSTTLTEEIYTEWEIS